MSFFGANIWSFEDEIQVAPSVYFPVRMTAIRLSSGSIVLHSPIKMSDQLVEQIQQLGSVDFIVAPNRFHHLFVLDAVKQFPSSELYLADGLEKKRRDIKNYQYLSRPPAAWAEELQVFKYEGVPKLGEYVFYHYESRTLITTDIVFNMRTAKNWLTRSILRVDGIYQKVSQGRLTDFMTEDKAKRAASNQRIMDLDFDKVLMAHGQAITQNAKSVLGQALLPDR